MRIRVFMLMLASCWLFLPTAYSQAAQEEVAIARSGSTLVRATSKNKTIEITIRTIRIDKSNNAFPFSAFPWQLKEWEFKEITIVKSLEISVNGKKIFVPWSIFADLINPLRASIGFKEDGFVLTINGGDAADSYFIRVFFDSGKVTRRQCYSSMEPVALTSETHYYRTELKDIP